MQILYILSTINLLINSASIHAFSISKRNNIMIFPQKVEITKMSLSSTTTGSTKNEQLEVTKDGVYICKQMPERLPRELKNTYYLLRHGQSWGNVEGVISSARSLATSEKHGLTPLGYEQGRASAEELLKLIQTNNTSDNKNGQKLYFYSSPFARARQTADACLEGLQSDENKQVAKGLNLDIQENVTIDYGLMERYFGRLDDAAIHTYAYVWPVDMFDPCHVGFEVESVAAVSTRLRETILKIEENTIHRDGGDIIVLTSHADVLQILQLYASGADNVGMFSSYRFTNGEVRLMGRTVDTLPEPQPLQPPKIGT